MSNYNGVEIAIIGMSGQFPGAGNLDEFWTNLQNGIESIPVFTKEELLEGGVPEALLNNPNYVKANPYIEDKGYFDASFFDYLPAEATLMDPQIRMFHEYCWKALEDAGYGKVEAVNRIGLFAGASSSSNWQNYALLRNREQLVDDYTASTLRDVSFLCSRISYLFNLQGPSIYVNTACSTSLVAVQRAAMSLLVRDCNMALAGGISLNNYSRKGYLYQEGMISSPDGHCRAFDIAAGGTVESEGVGVVVLKRLEDAIADRDHIYGVIRGSGINNDGTRKVGYTAPAVDGQYQVIRKAIQMAGVEPESITYVEAHGTGTKLGDPVEVEALNLAFGKSTHKYCALGSVKTNIGHLDAAAGIAGLIKTVLALKKRKLPPSLHFNTSNPKINFEGFPFFINDRLREWDNNGLPLRAGVSSFGIGGTNVHLVLEEAPKATPSSVTLTPQLLLFSGKTPAALGRNISAMKAFLAQQETLNLADVAYTLQTGRKSFNYRKAIVCNDQEEALQLLETYNNTAQSPVTTDHMTTVFMFPGQGAQYAGMCKDLYQQAPVFRKTVDKCVSIIKEISGKDLLPLLLDSNVTPENNEINNTAFAQPALFVVEYALSCLLMSWGIKADVMIGHSIGEYVAATISGVFSLKDAISIVMKRGALMQCAPGGKMLSIHICEKELQALLDGNTTITIAAVNSPEYCTVAGTTESILDFQSFADQKGYKSKLLVTSHAFHSYLMDGITEAFETAIAEVTQNAVGIPFISNVTGEYISSGTHLAEGYWASQLRNTVQFSGGISKLLEEEHVVFLEVGPGRTLNTFVRANSSCKESHYPISLVRHPLTTTDDLKFLLEGIAKAWECGLEPDWKAFHGKEIRNRLSLPTYAFERVAFPVNVDAERMITEIMQDIRSEKKQDMGEWFYTPSWKLSDYRRGDISGSDTTCWLVFSERRGIGETLTGLHRKRNGKTIVVGKDTSFREEDVFNFYIDPEQEEHYQRLFNRLVALKLFPDTIVYAWKQEGNMTAATSVAFTYSRIMYHFQRISSVSDKQFVLITSHLHPVLDKEITSPIQVLGATLLKVFSQEYPTVGVRHIDIALPVTDHVLPDRLYRDILGIANGKVISYRNGHRWEQVFEKVQNDKHPHPLVLKKGGVYIITGGMGNFGYRIAVSMLKSLDAKVALLGRQLTPDEDRFGLLQVAGGKVMYLSCDVSDVQALQHAVDEVERRFGPVNGIIHAAGIVHDRELQPVTGLTKKDFEAAFIPKVNGLMALYQVMKHKQLDFCMLTSSLSVVLGGIGLGAYAAANAFMDYFISSQHQQGKLGCWISVDLDGLSFSPNETVGINESELFAMFERALTYVGLPRVIVSVTDLAARLEKWLYHQPKLNYSPDETTAVADIAMDNTTYSSTTDSLLGLWRNFFGKPAITTDDDFFEIGGDSLKVLTMIGRIHRALNVEISVKDFFDRPTIKLLSEFIDTSVKPLDEKFISIPMAKELEYYKLSAAQQRLFYLYEFDRTSLAYNMPQVIRLKGALDKEKMTNTFRQLVARHESLRTSFTAINGEPVQYIAPAIDFSVSVFHTDEEHANSVVEDFIKPFDLSKAPLARVGLIELGPDDYLLITDLHHIITDGVSNNILVEDFMLLYAGNTLSPLNVQYKDYSEWQQSADQLEKKEKLKAFWLKQFEGDITPLDLPVDFERPGVKSFEGSSLTYTISGEKVMQLKVVAEREDSTMFMLILAIYNILMNKLTTKEDIIIGIPVAGRQHADLERTIGMFVDTLVLRNYPKREMSFSRFLAALKSKTLECLDNQAYQYERLISDLNIKRDAARNPLFDVRFVYQNFERSDFEVSGLSLTSYERKKVTSQFDLTLYVTESPTEVSFEFVYATDLFREETITRFIGYFDTILQTILVDQDVLIGEIEVVPEKEQKQLLMDFNNTGTAYRHDRTFIELFEEQVTITPDQFAVVCEGERLTYQELWDASRILAEALQKRITINANVAAIYTVPSLETIIGILAVLRAGMAFLPLDPVAGISRANDILQESRPDVLLVQQGLRQQLTFAGEEWVIGVHETYHCREKRQQLSQSELAYVIYTSGSTGTPKGVKIKNSNLVNYTLWAKEKLMLNKTDRSVLTSSYAFDLGYTSIFPILLSGGQLHLIPKSTYYSPESLLDYIHANDISYLKLTPSLFSTVVNAANFNEGKLNSVRYILLGGEMIRIADIEKTHGVYNHILFINHYGPTETTIGTVAHEITDIQSFKINPVIGKPISNTEALVLDKSGKLVPIGVIGELCIAGNGVGDGYMYREALTSEKFVATPYLNNKIIYKTGDYAKWLSNGTIAYLGRMDRQVKISGYRIEPGEIEVHLRRLSGINDAVVIAKEEKESDNILIAYYVEDGNVSSAELRKELSDVLPDYMLPAYFIAIDSIPLTSNGKVDLKQLPAPVPQKVRHLRQPVNGIQLQLIDIWANVLKTDPDTISIDKNFFEAGGNSIKLIRLLSKIKQQFGVQLAIAELFKIPTISLMANAISGLMADKKETEESEREPEERDNAIGLLNKIRD